MTASKQHSNRDRHNWLIYDLGDKFREACKKYYKGVMYDLGCGEKPYKEFFLQHVERYIGIDWGNSLHDSKADILADLNEPLPLDNECADTTIAFSVLEHLHEPQTMLDEAFRVLKPGGAMVLTVPWQWHVHEAPHDYFRFTPYGLKYLLEKAGFAVVTIKPLSGFFTTWVLKFNYFTKRLVGGTPARQAFMTALLTPVWSIGQHLAALLDARDTNWNLEATGFGVVARKPHKT